MKKLILLIALIGLSSSSFADGYFRFGGIYIQSKDKAGATETTKTRLPLEAGLGYMGSTGWAFGGRYAYEKFSTSSGGTTSEGVRSSQGVVLGYLPRRRGLYVLGAYYLSSELKHGGVTDKGNGYQADVGYLFALNRTSLGLQLSYKVFKYKDAADAEYEQDRLDPGLFLVIPF